MNENQIIEKIAQDLCSFNRACSRCNASEGFECTAKKYAKRIYELGYHRPSNNCTCCSSCSTVTKGRN